MRGSNLAPPAVPCSGFQSSDCSKSQHVFQLIISLWSNVSSDHHIFHCLLQLLINTSECMASMQQSYGRPPLVAAIVRALPGCVTPQPRDKDSSTSLFSLFINLIPSSFILVERNARAYLTFPVYRSGQLN